MSIVYIRMDCLLVIILFYFQVPFGVASINESCDPNRWKVHIQATLQTSSSYKKSLAARSTFSSVKKILNAITALNTSFEPCKLNVIRLFH